MKVAEWICQSEAEGKLESIGRLGGWFGFDQPNTWADYLATWEPDSHPYVEAVRDDVLSSGRFLTGEQHQEDPQGVPLFEDGTVAVFSWRGWGDLMAAIATVKDGGEHNYMEFYM